MYFQTSIQYTKIKLSQDKHRISITGKHIGDTLNSPEFVVQTAQKSRIMNSDASLRAAINQRLLIVCSAPTPRMHLTNDFLRLLRNCTTLVYSIDFSLIASRLTSWLTLFLSIPTPAYRSPSKPKCTTIGADHCCALPTSTLSA
jgi:hypothetical protein